MRALRHAYRGRWMYGGLAAFAISCGCAPSDPSSTITENWRRIYTSESTEVFFLKKPGLSNLLVYIGLSPNGPRELASARSALSSAGYNILTLARRPAAPDAAGASPVRQPGPGLREFTDFAENLSGYDKKVLVVPGEHLHRILPPGDAWSALVVLRPGDAPFRDKKLQETLGELPGTMNVFWLSSGAYPEYARSRRLGAKVSARLHQHVDPSLKRGSRERFRLNLAPRSDLENFLLLHHLTVLWRDAAEVFPGGCAFKAGGRGVRLDGFRVSSRADRDVCPLFLRRKEAVFRAGNLSPEGCSYPESFRGRTLHCSF